MKNLLSLTFLYIYFFSSCDSIKEGKYLASYKNDFLKIEEVLNQKPSFIDSSLYVSDYVDKWLKNKVLLDKAKIYIDEDDNDISYLINKYKETIIIDKYINELINNNFDTIITEEEINEYYNKYISDFYLKMDILKARFIIFDNSISELERINQLIKSNDRNDLIDLQDICEMYAIDAHLDDSSWVVFSEFYEKLPLTQKEIQRILSVKNKLYSFTDDKNIYLFFIRDFQIKGSKTPLSFEFDRIRKLIRNKKKMNYIESLEMNFYEEAISLGNIKIYK